VTPDLPDLVAEAAFAARREQTRSVADVLLRRTRLGLLDSPRLTAPGSEEARAVARAMGGELGWDEAQTATELEAWRELARVEGLVLGASQGDSAGAREPGRMGQQTPEPERA